MKYLDKPLTREQCEKLIGKYLYTLNHEQIIHIVDVTIEDGEVQVECNIATIYEDGDYSRIEIEGHIISDFIEYDEECGKGKFVADAVYEILSTKKAKKIISDFLNNIQHKI